MIKLHQLTTGTASPWLGDLTPSDLTTDCPVRHRSETDVFPGRHDRREK